MTAEMRASKFLALSVVVVVVFAATITGGFYVTALFTDGESVGIQFSASATVSNTAGNTPIGSAPEGNETATDGNETATVRNPTLNASVGPESANQIDLFDGPAVEATGNLSGNGTVENESPMETAADATVSTNETNATGSVEEPN